MEERDQNVIGASKISTLEESLKHFDKACLLEQLDVNLELVRRNKATKEDHLLLFKSADKDLLKLSKIHHPDKAIGQKKLDGEIENAQNMQIALNATRTVLNALTEVFLKDIDVQYKYEFFAKLDINTLIDEKQIDLEINNVLCKISRLSEIKRVNIIGEIRKFLLICQNCLKSFHHDNKYDFVRHRDNALHHLHKCIEGYEILFKEFKLIIEDCSAEEDKNTRRVVQNMYEQSLRESKILQNLQITAKRSLDGTFEIFRIYEPRCNDPKKPMDYESVVPQELDYFVSPFVFYVNVLLMCSVMLDKKSQWIKFKTKIRQLGETFENWLGIDTEEYVNFKEPMLLKAYHLASYFNNENYYKEEVQVILREKDYCTNESKIIREVFKQTTKEIEELLAKQFDINSYLEGKSNREPFNERLFENTSYALSIFEIKTLAETRSFTNKCENKIAKDKQNFAAKSAIGLWWDAKGIFNSSDVADVTDHMEKYEKFYNEIDTFSAQVEKGDPKSYDKLLVIYKDLEEMERDALRDVENNQSSAICLMLREFLGKKYNLDHNLKKVECIVLKQKMSDIEQTCKSSKDAVYEMSKRKDKLIEEYRAVRQGSDEKLQQALKEAEEKNAARIREMRKQNDELRLEADQRSEAIRRKSEQKLSELIQENRGIK